MRGLRFSAPKGPGYGIAKGYYLSVLSPQPTWPPAVLLANPQAGGGALDGFAVPLTPGKTKDDLGRPMERGAYAVATRDRKTVLRMLLMSKEEAGFDPEPFVRNVVALQYPGDMVTSIRATWSLAQFTFESHDPDVYPALDFLLGTVDRLAGLVGGVVADPISRRYQRPAALFQVPRLDPRVDAREHVAVHLQALPTGLSAFTLGLQKFALPEIELPELAADDGPRASERLTALAQTVLVGGPVREGQRFGPFSLVAGGQDRARWEGVPVLELRTRSGEDASEALGRWN